MASDTHMLMRRVRGLLLLFVTGLVLSGLTAVPLRAEVDRLNDLVGPGTFLGNLWPALSAWISRVHGGITDASRDYPFLFYGTDWLAFGLIVIAIVFIGPIRDPVGNVWVVQFGMIACVLVVPFALIAGGFRGIPFFWRLIDCSFGVFGIVPLWLTLRYIRMLASAPSTRDSQAVTNSL